MARSSGNRVPARRGVSGNVIATVAIVVLAVAVIGGILVFGGDGDGGGDGGDGGDTAGEIPAELRAGPDSNTLTEAEGDAVTIVEFLDYQCPACAAYYTNVTKQLEEDYADRVTFVTRNFPLSMHPLAQPAARAAEAAAAQGRYREMYHQLYDNYQQWAVTEDGQRVSDDEQRATTLFDSYATEIGLDLDRFHTDLASAEIQRRIDADVAAGERVGVSSTPTIYVNGEKFESSAESFDDVAAQLRDQIDEALG
ncbi:DsbA family protein [Actinophytocola gossypii]|uniref:Thioredoxin domain-containing protein n=1 Tax=Actinophytocola gossypii TaxID=2812003 RepID=A0ABT2J2L3_9PSEU|nr:DsbA family protein [Actinophytocola gossypii]MCT2582098.1 thioredoxin domain-containing protein [Actinophytocola gossypii]